MRSKFERSVFVCRLLLALVLVSSVGVSAKAQSGGDIFDNTTVDFSLVVSGSFFVDDVNVMVDITHTNDADLDVFLKAPDGTTIELFTDVGGGGDHFSGTTLDDEASTPITSGSAPFSGSYQPEESLSGFDNKAAQGTWMLFITDDKDKGPSSGGGTLNSWSIELTPQGLSIDDVQLAEGDSGSTMFVFTVTRSGDVSGTTSVDYATADGTATAGSDYTAVAGTLMFLTGETTRTITVNANGDTIPEPDETFTVNLSNAVGGTISVDQGLGTILNDERIITINDATVIEGDESIRFIDDFVTAGSGGLNLPRDMALGPDNNLYVSSTGGDEILRYEWTTGTFIDDFVATGSGGLDNPKGLVFGPDGNGDGVEDLYVASPLTDSVLRYDGITGDPLPGILGAFNTAEFVPTGSGGLVGPYGLDFGPDGNLYVSDVLDDLVLRYDGVTGAFIDEFTPTPNSGLNGPRKLAFAADGNLYVASEFGNAILRYQGPAGNDPGAFIDEFVSIATPFGFIFGPDDNFYVDSGLLGTSGTPGKVNRYQGLEGESPGAFIDTYIPRGSGGLGGPSGMLFDSHGNLYVGSFQRHEVLRYGAASQAVFTVTLSSPSAVPVSVDFSTADGTATAGSDYTSVSGTVWFDPGVTTRTIIVQTIDDAIAESDETFSVELSNPSGGTAILDNQGQGEAIISDDDELGITVTPASGLTTSEAGGQDSFDIVLSGPPLDEVTIGISSSDTSEGTVDVTSITFIPANWDIAQTVTIIGVDDPDVDGDITYTIITAAATSTDPDYNGLDADDVSVTNQDDDSPPGGGQFIYQNEDTPPPLDIPDQGMVSSTIFDVGSHTSIANLAVALNIIHPRPSDLEVFLIGPAPNNPNPVQLFSYNGDNDVTDSFTSTAGDWTLVIYDTKKKKEGTLNSWSITIDTP